MAKTKSRSNNEAKGYRRKRQLGLVPHAYDKNSASFRAGAWRHHDPATRRSLERALHIHAEG